MSTRGIRVLLFEDNPTDALLFEEALAEVTSIAMSFEHVTHLQDGLTRLGSGSFDVAVVDLGLPDSQGLETLRSVLAARNDLAVVVLTGLDDEELGAQAVREGAQDYLVKREIRGPLLARTLRYAVERARSEAQLKLARDEALEASRLKSAFLANMSHEIRTPLSIISGFVGLIGERAREVGDGPILDCMDPIRRACERLLDTVEGILDLSKIEAGTFTVRSQPQDLGVVTRALIEELRPLAARKNLTMSISVRDPEAIVWFDEYCLTHALMNLLANAIKFTDEGGVEVAIDRDSEGALRLEVRDTGIGIDPLFLHKLFQPFSQEDSGSSRRFEGNGLGLALTKRFLSLNGASIVAESEKGRGATFRIRFANDRQPAKPTNGASGDAPEPRTMESWHAGTD
jgi:signal transduction histidine kinase